LKRKLLLLPALLLFAACTAEDDPVVPPGPDVYTATGDFHNLLVGNGSIDTRTSFLQGNIVRLGDYILPNGAARDRGLVLNSPAQAVALRFYLTEGDGTFLNPGEVFNLNNRGDYAFMAFGDVRDESGPTRPTLLQMDALADPPAGAVRFRFFHALAGWTGAVDVHVNGRVLANVRYGHETAPVLFDARSAGEDSLVVVPAGEDPGGPYALWADRGADLFDAGTPYEVVLVHEPLDLYYGDVAGRYRVIILAQ
jgi:hypothetical protein